MNLPTIVWKSEATYNGAPLYLNADNFGNINVQSSVAPTNEWILIEFPMLGSFMMINVASGQALAVGSHGLTTTTDLSPSGNNTWTYSGGAVRPLKNDDLNLNIEGDSWHPGTPVILYKWDNAPNSKWTTVTV